LGVAFEGRFLKMAEVAAAEVKVTEEASEEARLERTFHQKKGACLQVRSETTGFISKKTTTLWRPAWLVLIDKVVR
jgi:hypothetical protein